MYGVFVVMAVFAITSCEDLSKIYPPPADITGVSITPSAATAFQGSTIQFLGEAQGVEISQAEKAVTWSVTGGGVGTDIDSNSGLLTIGSTETAALTVRATAVANPSISNTAAVSVRTVNDVTDIIITGSLTRTTYYRGTPLGQINLEGLTVTAEFDGGSADITAAANNFLIVVDGSMNAVGQVELTVEIGSATAASNFSIIIEALIVPDMNFSGTAMAGGWVLYNQPGRDIPLPSGENLIPPFGAPGTVLPKVAAATQFIANTWQIHEAGSIDDEAHQGTVQNSEMIGGRIRGVLRFNKPQGNSTNSGPTIRIPLGDLSGGQWFYINTWFKLISSDGPLATGDNANEYRISIYNGVTAAIANSTMRSKAVLGGGPSSTGRIQQITTEWQSYSFLVYIPATYNNQFLEVRLFAPNNHNAVTIDMANVEMIVIPAP